MYSTCLFCQQPLGSNETFETFPVGRRLAFDPERGRLWVVCRNCARWNLTPLEERWEAIEEAERRFRGTRLKAGTGEIALARLPEGTELVRIGRPARMELAAWRYGDQFGRRRRRRLVIGGITAAAGVAATGGLVWAGVSLMGAFQLGRAALAISQRGFPWTTVATVRPKYGPVLRIRSKDLALASLDGDRSAGLQLTLREHLEDARPTILVGEEAKRAISQILPSLNRMGGTPDEVKHALQRIDAAGTPERFFAEFGRHSARFTVPRSERRGRDPSTDDVGMSMLFGAIPDSGLFALPPTLALAAEMVAHEDLERQALEGELAALEEAWREAEEVAKIADDLLLPSGVESKLQELRRKLRR